MNRPHASQQFFDRTQSTLRALWKRWQLEKDDPEANIRLYLYPMAGFATECGVKLIRMTKRPFGVVIDVPAAGLSHPRIFLLRTYRDGSECVRFHMTCSSRGCKLARLKKA